MALEVALVGHGGAAERVLQALHGAVVALAAARVAGVLAVVLHQRLQLGAAHVQGTSEIERDIGRMVRTGLAVFV